MGFLIKNDIEVTKSFDKSVCFGTDLVTFSSNLSNQYLVDLRERESVLKRQSRFIAESIFDRMPRFGTFKENFDWLMTQKTTLLFVNQNSVSLSMVFAPFMPRLCNYQIAYFRYLDGSTVKLVNSVGYSVKPCFSCLDVQKCTCSIKGLSL